MDNGGRNGVHVLIAEDSPTQSAQLAFLLEDCGYRVTATKNGRDALAALETLTPSLVITDVVMPEMDGYGLCKAIKTDPRLKQIPVMLVTTLADAEDVIRGLECGADNFIRKPYDERYLLSRVEYLLANQTLRKNQKMQMGVEISLGGERHFITSERQQILDLLISTYEQAVQINAELKALHSHLEDLVEQRTAELEREVAERKEVERRLRVQMERATEQAALIDAAHDAVIVRDLDHRILFWSRGAERLHGWSADEVVGRRYDDLVIVDHVAFDSAVHALLRGGDWSGETRTKTSGGAERIVDARWTLVRDASGIPKSVLTLESDVTDRRKAERQLLESEERYRLLFDRNPHPIWVYDVETLAFLAVNDAAVNHYGYSREEFLSMTLKDIRPPEDVPDLLHNLDAHQESPTPQNFGVFRHRVKNGKVIEVEISSSEITFAGRRAGLVLAMDVTDRRRLEQQFLRAQRMESIGTLAGGIAHDLNNLLMPIMMGVSLLRRIHPDSKSLRSLDNIERSARRGRELVNQVLSFARGVEGSRIAVHIGDICREIRSIVESTFPKNLDLQVDIPTDLWWVDADPTQLHQVFLNLCVNARDAMPGGGRIMARARNVEVDEQYAQMHRGLTSGKYVMVEIADEGVGISQEIVDRIFEPFFTTKERSGGTGLGLSTVSAIVRSHGGVVNVYSEPGKGTSFKIYLRARKMDDSPVPAESKTPDLPRGNGELLLVVDDETDILSITQQTLETFGYRVLTAVDGADAVSVFALHRGEIDLVVTDMMMPVLDGPALVAALRRISRDVPIIASSGLNDEDRVARAAQAGVIDFLQKPYSADTLVAKVAAVLNRKAGLNDEPRTPSSS